MKTHCIRGHERTPENLLTNGRCRVCKNILSNARRKYGPGEKTPRLPGLCGREAKPAPELDPVAFHKLPTEERVKDPVIARLHRERAASRRRQAEAVAAYEREHNNDRRARRTYTTLAPIYTGNLI